MSDVILSGGSVLNPAGDDYIEAADVRIRDGLIVQVESGRGRATERDAGRVLDLAGRYVIPGLIDSHFHLISRSATRIDDEFIAIGTVEGVISARQQIEAGVTTVRDAGCRHNGIYALKKAIDEHLIPGPRAFVTGLNPTGTGAPASWRNVMVDGPNEMRRVVRAEWGAGADWIKLILAYADDPTDWASVVPYLTGEEITAAADEAHWKGIKIGCHCEGLEIARLAVRSGLDCLDHAPLIDEELAAEMAAKGVAYVPTLWHFSADTGLDLEAMPTAKASAIRRWQEEHRRSVGRAASAGVTIGAGTDAKGAVPARDVLVREMIALTSAGLTNVEALRAATINGATILGQQQRLGSLERGKVADIVVVNEDPLRDLKTLQQPSLVMKEGQILISKGSGGTDTGTKFAGHLLHDLGGLGA